MLNRRWWLTPEMVNERNENDHERLRAQYPRSGIVLSGPWNSLRWLRYGDVVTIAGNMLINPDVKSVETPDRGGSGGVMKEPSERSDAIPPDGMGAVPQCLESSPNAKSRICGESSRRPCIRAKGHPGPHRSREWEWHNGDIAPTVLPHRKRAIIARGADQWW